MMDKLAQDSTAALSAGMSYGRWKAMQEHVEIEKPPLPEDWKECAWCGKPFKLKTKQKRLYCEVYCQKRAQAAKDKRKRMEGKGSGDIDGKIIP